MRILRHMSIWERNGIPREGVVLDMRVLRHMSIWATQRHST